MTNKRIKVEMQIRVSKVDDNLNNDVKKKTTYDDRPSNDFLDRKKKVRASNELSFNGVNPTLIINRTNKR